MSNCELISSSGFITIQQEKEAINNCKKIGIEKIQYQRIKNKFLGKWAGTPQERLNQITTAFNSKNNIIWNCFGESGSIQFINNINYSASKGKTLIGSSDFTLILNKAFEKTNKVHIYGPNASTKLDDNSAFLIKLLLDKKEIKGKFKTITKHKSNIEGIVKGGNLISITWGIGSKHEINFNNSIVVLDKLGKDNYSTYNNLMQLKNTPLFKPQAIVITKIRTKRRKQLFSMIKELLPNTPILYDLSFDNLHVKKKSFPIGGRCNIDFETKTLTFYST